MQGVNLATKQEDQKVTQEQRENLDKLENIRAELWKVADLYNLAGYKPSAAEVATVDNIAQLAATLQKLARL